MDKGHFPVTAERESKSEFSQKTLQGGALCKTLQGSMCKSEFCSKALWIGYLLVTTDGRVENRVLPTGSTTVVPIAVV